MTKKNIYFISLVCLAFTSILYLVSHIAILPYLLSYIIPG